MPSKKQLTQFEQAQQLVKQNPVSYDQVSFPMTYVEGSDGQFRFANGHVHRLAPIGAGYLRERLRSENVRYGDLTRWLHDGEYAKLAELTQAHAAKLAGIYIAAVYDKQVVGLMAKYNPVSHKDLLAMVASLGLQDQVVSSQIDQYGFSIDLAVTQRAAGHMQVALRCYNGHSGHYALKYQAVFSVEDYEYEARLTGGRRRHLSTVSGLIEALNDSLVEARGLKIISNLEAQSANWALTLMHNEVPMTITREKLLAALHPSAKAGTALELAEAIGAYSNSRGWGSAVSGLLQPVMKAAAEL